jgi:AraC-like DNA-binding protein
MIESQNHEAAITNYSELAALIDRHTTIKGNGIHPMAIDSLEFTREYQSGTVIPGICKPLLGIVVQGKKELLLNKEIYRYGVGQYLVLSVDLPVSACVTAATPDRPYLGFKLNLDPVQLCDIIAQTNLGIGNKESVRGCFISNAEPSLLDCAIRLIKLLDTPQDISFLAPSIVREIYYRLLSGEQGEAVRQIATSGSNMQRIAEVIRRINVDFAKPLRVEELADGANMSASSFHRHFKAITSMSPVQYQKQLKLLSARQMMLAENADATQAAYQVGYESTSQFSREYSRMFGAPPHRDVERSRIACGESP